MQSFYVQSELNDFFAWNKLRDVSPWFERSGASQTEYHPYSRSLDHISWIDHVSLIPHAKTDIFELLPIWSLYITTQVMYILTKHLKKVWYNHTLCSQWGKSKFPMINWSPRICHCEWSTYHSSVINSATDKKFMRQVLNSSKRKPFVTLYAWHQKKCQVGQTDTPAIIPIHLMAIQVMKTKHNDD